MNSCHTPLAFYKYSGCGNDFILIDNRQGGLPASFSLQVPHLCSRHTGIGADGVILINAGRENAAASIVYFNSDGSLAEQCGNGLRCAIRCLHDDLGIVRELYSVETPSGICQGRICGEDIEIRLGHSTPVEGPLRAEEAPQFPLYSLKVGVPHAVLICKSIKEIDVDTLGRQLRNSPLFAPHGANVNFVEITDEALFVRTYERGVESETQACGTGAAASAIAAALHFKTAPFHKVRTRGGSLSIHFQLNGGRAEQIVLRGEARRSFQGLYRMPAMAVQPHAFESLRECHAVNSSNFSPLG